MTLRVTVQPDGTASDASILNDSGHGFGSAARSCALAVRYRPALDREGHPILSSGTVNIQFRR